jgi:hypothetical protein
LKNDRLSASIEPNEPLVDSPTGDVLCNIQLLIAVVLLLELSLLEAANFPVLPALLLSSCSGRGNRATSDSNTMTKASPNVLCEGHAGAAAAACRLEAQLLQPVEHQHRAPQRVTDCGL